MLTDLVHQKDGMEYLHGLMRIHRRCNLCDLAQVAIDETQVVTADRFAQGVTGRARQFQRSPVVVDRLLDIPSSKQQRGGLFQSENARRILLFGAGDSISIAGVGIKPTGGRLVDHPVTDAVDIPVQAFAYRGKHAFE